MLYPKWIFPGPKKMDSMERTSSFWKRLHEAKQQSHDRVREDGLWVWYHAIVMINGFICIIGLCIYIHNTVFIYSMHYTYIYSYIYIYMYSYDPLNLTFHLKISGTRSTSSLLSSRIDLRFRCTSSKCFATAEISTTLQCRNTTTFELWIWDNHEISLGFLTSFTSKFEKIRKFIVCQMCDTWSFRTSSKKFEDGTCGTTWRSCKMENYSIAFICKSTSIEVNTFIAN